MQDSIFINKLKTADMKRNIINLNLRNKINKYKKISSDDIKKLLKEISYRLKKL